MGKALALLQNRNLYGRFAFVVAMAAWPLWIHGEYVLSVMVVAGIYATMSLSLGLLLGQAGLISFGQGAFFGIGAYACALGTTRLHMAPLAALVLGAVLCAIAAVIVGLPVLRLKGFFLALATMGLAVIFTVFAQQLRGLTGGQNGIVNIPPFSFAGVGFNTYLKEYYLVWAIVLAMMFLAERAMASRVGRALRAFSVSEAAAATLGINTSSWKMRTFVVGSMIAGIGGGLFSFVMSAISSTDFSLNLSLLALIMVMVGGPESLFGAVMGAVLMTWAGEVFAGYQQYTAALYAAIFILLLLFLPAGLSGIVRTPRVRALWDRLARPARPSPSPGEAQGRQADRAAREGGILLRLEGLDVFFGGVRAVDQVSLQLSGGLIGALIGPNGAGKTTLFNAVTGLEKLSGGRAWFGDREITRLATWKIARLGIARTFQNLHLFVNMTVLENVMVGRHRHERLGFVRATFGPKAREETASRERSLAALRLVGLEHLADWSVTALPYGQQRLVEVARALASEPRFLLLDEPAAGMNTAERVQLMERIARIRAAGVTVLLVEHDVHMVMGISDNVWVLDYGKLIAAGKPADVQADPVVIEAYVGAKGAAGTAPQVQESPGGGERPVLEVAGVSTYYGSIAAVQNVSLAAYPGEMVAVLGANGAGKTTLLRTISGLLRPREGRIVYAGRDISRLSPAQVSALGVGHVPEGRLIFPTLSVADNLMLGAGLHMSRPEIRRNCDFVYDLFPRLAERRRQIAGTLSGGEQQMLAIGRALTGRPQLLLLDEPSMGLAPLVVELIFETLGKLNQQGQTMIIVEQNAQLALSVAHRAVVLQTGRVALAGPSAVLAQDARIKALYLGDGRKECG